MWEILGIEPTTDLKAIKSAYARLAKQYNPEEDPEGFQRVYAAYKRACIYAKAAGDINETALPQEEVTAERAAAEPANEPISDNAQLQFDFSSVDIFPDYDLPMEKRFEKMLDNIKMLLDNVEKKDSIPAWYWIFQKDDFELLADDKNFRAAAEELLSDELFSPETASAIARVFGHGTRAIPFGKNRSGQERWKVWISGSGQKAPPRGYKMPSYMNSAAADQPFNISVRMIVRITVIVLFIVIVFARLFSMLGRGSGDDDDSRQPEATSVTRSGDFGGVTIYMDEDGHVIGTDRGE